MKAQAGLIAFLFIGGISSQVPAEQPDVWDVRSDTWVATDALDRKLPTYEQCGPPRTDRYVGIFYFLWLGAHGEPGPHDISKILSEYPNAVHLDHPWGPLHAFHHWGEPEWGYYLSNDAFVIRKHCHALADAGIDTLIFDVTNGWTYQPNYELLCSIYRQIRQQGGQTPQICFLGRTHTLEELYNNFYSRNMYPELWFHWKGKPLFLRSMAFPDDPEPSRHLRDFFTLRKTWAFSHGDWFGDGQDRWLWSDHYPQGIGWHEEGVPEEMSVSIAMQESYMSYPSAHGRHYHDGDQPSESEWTGHGYHFAEQWDRALAVDPEFVFITGWNEWVAQRFESNTGVTRFVDCFNQEFSRDVEPMKGGYYDNYYYQMIDYIRRFKGVRQPTPAGPPQTITIDGQFEDWTDVQPEFRDTIGDIAHRNHEGWGAAGPYINTTGRNDIVASKVAYDDDSIYFYVRTDEALTPYTGSNWLTLFINADCDRDTGWEGYDYLVNKTVSSPQQTTLHRCTSSNQWSQVATVPIRWSGQEVEIVIPREHIGKAASADAILEFHWADNIQQFNDITEFAKHGDSAPNRRFNYRFTADRQGPAAVSNLTTERTGEGIRLAWSNPTDCDYAGTTIRCRTDRYPVDHNDGVLICDRSAERGATDSFMHEHPQMGKTYYYAAFTYDAGGHYSDSVKSAQYFPLSMDFDNDADVDMEDFGKLQLCLTGSYKHPTTPDCQRADLDGDKDIDEEDKNIFFNCFTGPGKPADSNCLP